jgi:hypothetical protein
MKIIIAVVILCAAAICAPAETKKKSNSAPAAPQALTIPKDAVANPDGTYSYTDKDGKSWTYTKTPFGVMKAATANAAGSAEPQPPATETKAIDKGDTVRFERPSPFGPVVWEKNKADLTDAERHILDAQNAKTQQND